jgi:hypothetical protein
MTNQQWRDELAACLEGTDWVVDWAGVIKDFPNCLAEADHRVTLRARHRWDIERPRLDPSVTPARKTPRRKESLAGECRVYSADPAP